MKQLHRDLLHALDPSSGSLLRDLADSLLLTNIEHLRPPEDPPEDPGITAMKARMARVRAAIRPPSTPDSAQEAHDHDRP